MGYRPIRAAEWRNCGTEAQNADNVYRFNAIADICRGLRIDPQTDRA